MGQRRLFVGLAFSDKFLKDLEPWVKKIKKTADRKDTDLYWIPPTNYHVTLVFLGNTNDERISDISDKMKSVAERHSSFKLKIRGLDGFPSLQQARVLYLGVQRSQNLLDLQSDLEAALKTPEEVEHGYVPHLTITRLRSAKSCRDLVSPFEHIDLGKQQVSEIILFSSQMAGSQVVYEKIFQTPLAQEVEIEV